jgi:hypothetical protein
MYLLRSVRAVAFASAAAVALAACAQSTSSDNAANDPTSPVRVAQPTGGDFGKAGRERRLGPDDKPSSGEGENKNAGGDITRGAAHDYRKVIRTGRVELVVATYDDARAKLEALVREVGGYVDSTTVSRGQGTSSSASIVVRVPSASFPTFLPKLRELGEVRGESTAGQDITDEYVDVAARLASARTLENRLLELAAAKNGTIDQVLAVERELARVRGEIESYEGRMKHWDDQVALSTLSIDMATKSPEIAPAAAPTLGERVTSTFHASVRSLRDAGQWIVVHGIAALPWLVLAAPLALFLRRLARRVRLPRAIAHAGASQAGADQAQPPAA